jgi:hypothetical protein
MAINKGNLKAEKQKQKEAAKQQKKAAQVNKCKKCKKPLGSGGMKDHKCPMKSW